MIVWVLVTMEFSNFVLLKHEVPITYIRNSKHYIKYKQNIILTLMQVWINIFKLYWNIVIFFRLFIILGISILNLTEAAKYSKIIIFCILIKTTISYQWSIIYKKYFLKNILKRVVFRFSLMLLQKFLNFPPKYMFSTSGADVSTILVRNWPPCQYYWLFSKGNTGSILRFR